jgi:hypothetical protein
MTEPRSASACARAAIFCTSPKISPDTDHHRPGVNRDARGKRRFARALVFAVQLGERSLDGQGRTGPRPRHRSPAPPVSRTAPSARRRDFLATCRPLPLPRPKPRRDSADQVAPFLGVEALGAGVGCCQWHSHAPCVPPSDPSGSGVSSASRHGRRRGADAPCR